MTIVVVCPTCGHRYEVRGKLAGKRVRCSECTANFRVPVPESAPRRARKRKEPRTSAILAEMLDPSGGSDDSEGPPTAPLGPRPARSGLRADRVVLVGLGLSMLATAVAWAAGVASRGKLAALACVVFGGSGLIASLGDHEGARAALALLGLALLSVGILLAAGGIAAP